jgi:hypothetical protein
MGDAEPPGAPEIGGVPVETLLSGLPFPAASTVWASGSCVEGFANRSSDVDVHVLVESPPDSVKWTKATGHSFIFIGFLEGRRVDYEYWTTHTIEGIADQLQAVPLGAPEENVLDALRPHEVELIHNVRVGTSLRGREAFDAMSGLFAFDRFLRYLVANATFYVNDAFDDTVGMLESGQLRSAALRARDTVRYSCDVALHALGDSSDKWKYRLPRLERLRPCHPELEGLADSLWRFETFIPEDGAGQKRYVEDALRTSSRIVEHVERLAAAEPVR